MFPQFPPRAPVSPLSFHLPLTLPSAILLTLSLSLFLDYSFPSSFSSLLPLPWHLFLPHTINKSTLEKPESSQPRGSPCAVKPGSINTGMAEELHAFLQSPLPGLTSLALQSAHLPSPQRGESMPVPICFPHYTDRRGVGHEHVFMKENCIFLKHFLEFFQTLFIQMKFGAFSNPFFKQPQSITVEHVGLSLQLLRKWHLKGLTHMNPSCQKPQLLPLSKNSTYNLAIVPITVTS